MEDERDIGFGPAGRDPGWTPGLAAGMGSEWDRTRLEGVVVAGRIEAHEVAWARPDSRRGG